MMAGQKGGKMAAMENRKYSGYSVEQLSAMTEALEDYCRGLEKRLVDGYLTNPYDTLVYIRKSLELRKVNMAKEATAKLDEMAELAQAESEACRKAAVLFGKA